MSREEYQVPTGSGSATGGGGGGGSFNAPAPRDYAGESGGTMYYMCGDCAVRVPLEKGAAIRCQKCGARVLYKERTKR
jgi:DNA-directed RNA polymerase I, II, and III subunit RPABC4